MHGCSGGGVVGCSGGGLVAPAGGACMVAPWGACVVALGGACVVATRGSAWQKWGVQTGLRVSGYEQAFLFDAKLFSYIDL